MPRPASPGIIRLWEREGPNIRPDDTRSSLMSRLGIPHWQARDLLIYHRTKAESAKPGAVTRSDDDTGTTLTAVNDVIRTPEDMVAAAGLDLETWEIVSADMNTWPVTTKGEDGEPTVTRLWQTKIRLRPRVFPLVSESWAPPPAFVVPEASRSYGPVRTALVLPDAQIGFKWVGLAEGRPHLEPFHDRKAIDLALQILARTQPDHVILIGDMLDFQALSTRWAFGDDARQTTRMAIKEWSWLLWRIREIAPSTPITYMLGNHEARLEKFLSEKAAEVATLGGDALDIRRLLNLDALAIESHPYPLPFWLWGEVEIEHGRTVRGGGGATAAAVLAKREHSVVYGHVHRAEYAQRTVETALGRRHVFAGSPGCLCRTDGIVPGSDRPDWQQGVGLISRLDESEMSLIRFTNGRCLYNGQLLTGRDYTDELADALKAPALKAA